MPNVGICIVVSSHFMLLYLGTRWKKTLNNSQNRHNVHMFVFLPFKEMVNMYVQNINICWHQILLQDTYGYSNYQL